MNQNLEPFCEIIPKEKVPIVSKDGVQIRILAGEHEKVNFS